MVSIDILITKIQRFGMRLVISIFQFMIQQWYTYKMYFFLYDKAFYYIWVPINSSINTECLWHAVFRQSSCLFYFSSQCIPILGLQSWVQVLIVISIAIVKSVMIYAVLYQVYKNKHIFFMFQMVWG